MELEIIVEYLRLQSNKYSERRIAVTNLSSIRHKQVIPYLVSAFSDKSIAVVVRALSGVHLFIEGGYVDTDIVEGLSNCLASHKDNDQIKHKIVGSIELILTITGQKFLDVLGPIITDLALNDESAFIRKVATSLLDILGDSGLPIICSALDDISSEVVLTALLTIDNLFRSRIYDLDKFPTRHLTAILRAVDDILMADDLDGRIIIEASMIRQMLDHDPNFKFNYLT